MKNDVTLREKVSLVINNITEWSNLVEANRQLENQIYSIAKLRHEYRHSISVVRWARREDPATYNYTCYMYAFDLMDHALLSSIAHGAQDIYPGGEFTTFLIRNFLKETEQDQARDDDLVLYFGEGTPKHAGKWYTGNVRSKWGYYSHLWQHGLYELPLEYGNDIRFFQQLSRTEIEYAFKQWAGAKFMI
jgi:hypothetical protein